ncbi:MAG: LamG-like jellyroll fold domain-containing protein [Candidatus Binatus sp.]
MSFKRIVRCALAALALAIAIVAPDADVPAQSTPNLPPAGVYQGIPNFTGVGAGALFRQAINQRFAGVQPISPTITNVAFASLPSELDGMMIFCRDCKLTTPCTASGNGAWALGARGQWSCSSSSLEANLNANSNKITSLATATTAGDALGYGQGAGGDLSGALPNPTVQTVLSGKVPIYAGETNPQFQTYAQPFVVSATDGAPGATSDSISKPAGAQQGDMLIYYIAVNASALSVTPPDGTWHLIKSGADTSGGIADASYYKVAGSSEPSSYTFTLSTGAYGTSGMVAVRQEKQSSPIDASSFFYSSSNSTSITIPAPSATQTPDMTLILVGNSSNPFSVSSPGVTAAYTSYGNNERTAGWSYASAPAAATVVNGGFSGRWTSQQISIAPAPFGPASAVLNGQTAATLASPTLTGITSIASGTVSGSIVGSGSASSVSQINLNGVLNVQNYGAVGNGAALSHDEVGEQAAIDAACANPNGTPATVYWPTPAKYYVNDAPLFVHCSNIRLLGPNMGSNYNPSIVEDGSAPAGPVFVFQQYSMPGVTLGTPLISGSTNSATFTGATNPYYVNLNDATSVVMGLNGASAATIDAYVKLTSTADGAIVWSSGRKAEYLGPTTAYSLRVSGGQFLGQMTINGVAYSLTDTTTTLAAGTLYDVQMTYDGTTIRLFTNGALVASSAHSGTITEPYWEVVTVGAQIADFPDGAIQTTPINGLIDGVQISKVARHTAAFTPCNCEPTNDSNNLVIASFDQNLNMLTQLQWQDVGGQSGWSYVRRGSTAGVFGVEMDGISAAGKKGAMAIIGQAFNGCHIRHSSFTNMTSGIYEFGNDFENTFDDLYIIGSYIDFFIGGQSGLQFLTGGINLVGGLVGLRVQDSGIVAQGMVVQQQAGMVWGYSIQGDTGTDYFACNGCGLDAELADSNWLGTLQLDNMEVASWTGGAASAIGSSPVVEIDGGSQQGSAVFSAVNFSPTSTSPEIFHVANSNLPGLATVIGPHLSSAAPWTDSPRDVVINVGASTTGLISSVTGGLSNVTPTVSSCGTGASVATGGTSNAFVVTVGSTNPTTSCTVSFGSSANFANTPVCTGQDISQGFALKQSALSTAGVTFTAPSGISDMHGDTINVQCIGK